MTLDRVEVILDKAFEAGMAYVALRSAFCSVPCCGVLYCAMLCCALMHFLAVGLGATDGFALKILVIQAWHRNRHSILILALHYI